MAFFAISHMFTMKNIWAAAAAAGLWHSYIRCVQNNPLTHPEYTNTVLFVYIYIYVVYTFIYTRPIYTHIFMSAAFAQFFGVQQQPKTNHLFFGRLLCYIQYISIYSYIDIDIREKILANFLFLSSMHMCKRKDTEKRCIKLICQLICWFSSIVDNPIHTHDDDIINII